MYICLAGWKQIILDEIVLAYPNKILNLHPGLIPDTIDTNVENPDGTKALWNKGMLTTKAVQNFFDKKTTFAGSSIHFLTLDFDFGPVLGRTFEKIEANDNIESLYSRLKKKENKLYVEVLEKLTSPQPSPDRRGRKGEVKQKILIIGAGGGREHALGWKILQSPQCEQIFFAPGNAGTLNLGINVDIQTVDIQKLIEFAKKENIDLTIAASDGVLATDLVEEFRKANLRIWGPTKAAAHLEWSKTFSGVGQPAGNLTPGFPSIRPGLPPRAAAPARFFVPGALPKRDNPSRHLPTSRPGRLLRAPDRLPTAARVRLLDCSGCAD